MSKCVFALHFFLLIFENHPWLVDGGLKIKKRPDVVWFLVAKTISFRKNPFSRAIWGIACSLLSNFATLENAE